MSEKVKLERIRRCPPISYTTGDAQDWTYEYTWEDFEAMLMGYKGAGDSASKAHNAIYFYFDDHPEKLFKDGVYLGKGYTTEQVKSMTGYPKKND